MSAADLPPTTPELACPFAELVDRRVLGDVSPEDEARLEAHLAAGCATCAPRLADQDHLERLIQGAFRPLEHEIAERRPAILAELKEKLAREDTRQLLRRRRRVGINSMFFFVVILGLLLIAAEFVAIPALYKGVIAKAYYEQGDTECHAIAVAILRFYAEHGSLPPEDAGLARSLGVARKDGARVYYSTDARHVRDGEILDPWNRPYVYVIKPGGFDVYSRGPNGKADGQGPHDIARWVSLPPPRAPLPEVSPSPPPPPPK